MAVRRRVSTRTNQPPRPHAAAWRPVVRQAKAGAAETLRRHRGNTGRRLR